MAARKKKKIQYSKIITTMILVIATITWLVGLVLYWDHIDLFNYLLDYVQSLSVAVLPYFCLSATDRLVYMQEAKSKGGTIQ